MKCNIFYSWQSDLPNNDNRTFVETCIKRAVKLNNSDVDLGLFLDYERDTRGEAGSPDIVEVIFNKIAKSDVFICDISIINSNYEGRKTPNPNVLLELGYAAKTLGWEKIICLYNIKYGSIKDIPFDLRHRRILFYNSSGMNAKKNLTQEISKAIILLHSKGLLFNPLRDYMKGKIDYCLLEILKQINCLVYNTVTMSDALSHVSELLALDKDTLISLIQERTPILGFFANNDLSYAEKGLISAFSAVTTSNIYPIEWAVIIIKALDLIRTYQYLISIRAKYPLFSYVFAPSSYFMVVPGKSLNEENPSNSYLLLKKCGSYSGAVLYSATMSYIDPKCLTSPHTIQEGAIQSFASCLYEILTLANDWYNETGDEFVLDPDYYQLIETKNAENDLE